MNRYRRMTPRYHEERKRTAKRLRRLRRELRDINAELRFVREGARVFQRDGAIWRAQLQALGVDTDDYPSLRELYLKSNP